MQLLIILFLLFGGVNAQKLGEVKAIAEELGGEQMKSVIEDAEKLCREAEQLGSVISAVRDVCGGSGGDSAKSDIKDGGREKDGATDCGGVQNDLHGFSCASNKSNNSQTDADGGCEFAPHGFPLEPVVSIADEEIVFCLSRYIALGE